MKKITSLMKRNLWISGGLLALVLIVIAFISMSGGSQKYEIATAKKGDIIQKVRVTGKVTPMQKADLGFEKGGVLAQKNVKVGEMVYQGQVLASLDVREQQAALDLAIAKLSSERTKLSTSQVSYDESKRALINAIRDSYTKIDGAIRNELDTFFTAPQSNPTINVRVESQNLANEMNRKRESITYEFIEWKKKIDSVGISDVSDETLSDLLKYSTAKIDSTKLFFNKMDSLVNSITTTNSGYSQSTIDGYNSTINTANTSFNSAISSLASAEKDFKTNASDLGISSTVMDSEQASIKQAIASVESARAVVEKSKLVSPIAGLVTRALPEVGEFISPGEVSFTVMTEDSFKVEVNVPESDIAKISLGNTASITLDAYGDSIVFSADVTMIDPAEVIVEGVPTYKVTLKFNEKDVRIRSGMTANIELITASKEGVISVPVRSVSIREGKRYVKIIDTDGKTAIEKLVVTGIQGSDGNIEIVSGINEGESVIVSVK